MRSSILALAVAAAAFSAPAFAQSVWGVNGFNALAQQMTGPAAGPCAYPSGGLLNSFNYNVAFPCPTAGPYTTAAGGDITIDRVNDTVWVTDGLWTTNYTKAGVPLESFISPIPTMITGLGWGQLGAANVLWITDGFMFAAIQPPPPIGCGAVPIFVVPPTPVTFPGMATDIDYDPRTGTLFMSNSNGLVSNQFIGGAPGPYGVFAPGGCFGGGLMGICVDTPGCKALYVTNGQTVAHINFGGGLYPPTFYTPNPCFSWAGAAPITGLAHDCSPIRYGNGCDSTAFTIPVHSSVGEAVSPNPAFTLLMSNSDPGNAYLLVGTNAACPGIPFMGCSILVNPISLVFGPYPHVAPNFTFPAPLPPGMPCPLSIYTQFVNLKFAGGVETTNALEFSIGMP